MMAKVKKKKKIASERFPLLFIGPALFFLIVFSIVPITIAFLVSFTNLSFTGLMDSSYIKLIGLNNYSKLFLDKDFIATLSNTLIFVIIGVPVMLLLSLSIAIFLNKGEKGLFATFRVVYYLPSLTNVVAISVVFGYLFNSNFGLLNFFLSKIGVDKVMWLLEPFAAKISVIMLAEWRGLGINIIIFLTALKSIPSSLFEAASIDGAGKMKQLFYIVIPSIKFAIFYVSMTATIIWLQLFEESFVLTKGGPVGATKSVVQFTYELGFTHNKFGYAAASSIVLFIIIFMVTMVQNKMRSRSE